MKPSSPKLTLAQVRAIREIERRLVELERRRECIERAMRNDDAEAKPAARKRAHAER